MLNRPRPTVKMAYPSLQSFIDKTSGQRFSKRVNFDNSGFEDLLSQIVVQINEKKARNIALKHDTILKEIDDVELLKKQLNEERQHEMRDKKLKQAAFLHANQILKQDKIELKEQELIQKNCERINYFPFTHGDLIEKQR